MMDSANGAPGYQKYPDYQIEFEAVAESVVVAFAEQTVARTKNAARMLETKHDSVVYIPRTDVRFDLLEATDHSTYCPFKGTARYWSITVGEKTSENAVWGYDAPYDEVAELADYVAFYLDRIDAMTIG